MRVRNSCLIDTKQFIIMFLIEFICISVTSALVLLIPYFFYIIIVILILFLVCWLASTVYFFSCLIYPLGYNIVDETGITRHFLFFKKHYNWNDLQFISKTRTYGRLETIIEKMIVSVEIPKEDFKRNHTYRLFSKKCFYMPYSKELEGYIIAKAPIDCYTYSHFIDDTIDKKYSKYNTQ